MPPLPPLPRFARRIAPALLLAVAAGALARQLLVPLPWLLGPLLAVAILRLAGARLEGPNGGRQLGQWLIASALGLHFTPPVIGELAARAMPIVLIAAASVGIGVLCALVLLRWAAVAPATALFAALPGGAAEMVVLAERGGAAVDRVAAAQALRVALVVLIVPFVFVHWAGNGPDLAPPPATPAAPATLAVLLGVALAGALLFARLRIANAWMLGPIAAVGALTAGGVVLAAPPAWAVNGGQLLLGVALGSRFTPSFFRAAPRFLGVAALGTGLTLLLCAAGSWLLAALTAVPLPSLALAAAPGGMAEMSVTAAVLHWSVPLVTATHVLRLALLTVGGPALCGLFLRLPLVQALAARPSRRSP